MRHAPRSLLFGCLVLAALCGCETGSYSSSVGSNATAGSATNAPTTPNAPGFTAPAGTSGSHNQVVATPSTGAVAVVVGASETVSIAFTSTDGLPMTGFSISGTLGTLPAGWSGPSSFVCARLSTGSDCVLNLTYAPGAIGGGTLSVGYVVVDDAGLAKTQAAISIPYAATAHDNVIAEVSPTGEVDAASGSGAATVVVDFITDDGNAATNLAVNGLGSLPAGWSMGSAASAGCAIVSTGTGCELVLRFAGGAAGSGLLSLSFAYLDDSGAAKTGTVNIPYRSTAANNVIATAAPGGEIIAVQKTGGQAVEITFTTDDGKAASNLRVTSSLKSLPPGWNSAGSSFSCASVGTGSGCQLPLIYAPTALATGTLSLAYSYTDASGAARAGLLNLPYAATTNDNVVGVVAPSGEVNAVALLGAQAIDLTFSTDDGQPATALQLTTSLAQLPAGWSSAAAAFSCPGVNADTTCVLPLTYAPAAAASGTLSLGYGYVNDAGEARTGTVNIAYRATTDDNVAGTPNQGSLSVRTGSTTGVTITFATDDGNPASLLSVSSLNALPDGWSASSGSFACATVSAGSSCTLALSYAPTAAATGSLSLAFSYANDAGFAKTGTVAIAYAATTPYLYVANAVGSTLSACPLNIDNSLAPCTATGNGFAGPTGIAFDGSFAYVTNGGGTSVSLCGLGAGGQLSNCAPSGGTFTAPTAVAVNPAGTLAYVDQSSAVGVCAITAASGALGSCAAAAAPFVPLAGIVLSADGTHAYGVQGGRIELCNVAVDGTFSACTPTASNATQALAALALWNGAVYASTSGGLYVCPLNADGSLGTCQNTAMGTNAAALAFIGTTAYVSSQSTTVFVCPVNADGTFGACTAVADPSFNGTAGLALH